MARLKLPLLAILFAGALAAPAAAEIIVGVAGPARGSDAAIARDIARAAKLAAEQINAEGGLAGEPVTVVEAEDGCAGDEAEAAARDLIAKGAAVVLGHPCASAAIAAAKVYAEAGTLFLAPATRHPALTNPRPGPTVFRIAGRDDRQGASAGAYLARAFAEKPVAVVYDTSRYGAALANGALAALRKAGHGAVLTATVAGAQKDFGALITRLAAARVEVVFFAGFPLEGGLLLRQMRAAGLKTVFIGSDALATSPFAETAGADAAGTGVLLRADPLREPIAAKVREISKGEPATGAFVRAYAALEAWRAAVGAAGAPRSAAVALQQGHFETVLGPLSFDDDGNAELPSYDVLWWKDGTWRKD